MVGTAVATPPTVNIKDADGKGMAGIAVTFAVATGGGTLTGTSATTDANGSAAASTWVLGTTAGTNTVTAAANVPGSPLTFVGTGFAGPATTITKISTDPISPPPGSNIDSITVKVADQFGNPVVGTVVTFAVTGGGGAISPASVTTGLNGLASAEWRVGGAARTSNSASASSPGLAAPTVAFSTTTDGIVASLRMAAPMFSVDSLISTTPGVVALDADGIPVIHPRITLVARTPTTVSVSGSTVRGIHPGQTFLIATSVDAPQATDSALFVVANIGAPTVSAAVPRFDLKTDTTFTVSVVVDMGTGTEKLGAATLQVTWNPNVLIFISDAEGSSQVGATLNTSNTATGFYTMTMANPSGFAGAVEMRRLTFKAASVAGRNGTLAITVLDLSGVALTNFVTKAVSPFFPIRTR